MRSPWTTRVVTLCGLALVLGLIAQPALASDSLELIPDYTRTLPIMLLGFVLLIFPLNQLIFKPIFRSLDDRAARIEGARDRSSHLQREAGRVLDRYETAIRAARGASEEARQLELQRAREEQATLTAQARGEAEAELERARADLGRSLEQARTSLRASAEELAQAAAEQVLGRTLS